MRRVLVGGQAASVASRYAPPFLLALLPYLTTLRFSLVWDDPILIGSIGRIASPADIGRLFTSNFPVFQGSIMYRPLVMLSLALDRAVFGDLAWGYHLTNALLHGVSAALVTALALPVLGDPRFAVLAGAIFALHPAHPEAVAFVSGRTDVLAACFVLAALVVFRGALACNRRWLLALAALLFLGALFSKESSIAMLVAFVLLAFQCSRHGERAPAVGAVAVLFGVAGLFLVVRHWVLHVLRALSNPYEQVISVLALPGLALRYLTLLLVPLQRPPFFRDVPRPFPQQISLGLEVFLAVALALLALAGGIHLARRRSWSLLPLSIVLLPMVPAFAFNLYGNPIMVERYLYLPSAGFAILVAGAMMTIPARKPSFRRAAVVGVTLLYGAVTLWRLPLWRDQITLFEGLRDRYPESNYVHMALAETYLQGGRLAEVGVELSRASALRLVDARYHHLSGWLGLLSNAPAKALEDFSIMLRMLPGNAHALEGLGLANAGVGNYQQALELLDRAERASSNPDSLRKRKAAVQRAWADAGRASPPAGTRQGAASQP